MLASVHHTGVNMPQPAPSIYTIAPRPHYPFSLIASASSACLFAFADCLHLIMSAGEETGEAQQGVQFPHN